MLPPDGGLSASQEAGIPHGNGVHADVRTSPEENVRGTFSQQENTQEKSPYRGKAEPAVAEPAPTPRERRKGKQTPPEGITALKKTDDPFVRSRWELGLIWDFTQDQPPPTQWFLTLGGNDGERWTHWRRMKRIVREALAAKQDSDREEDPPVQGNGFTQH
jgi:hypothetical protein